MKVTLLASTPNADKLCGMAAAICTNYQGDAIKAQKGAIASGHESVCEHASFTFKIEGVSRVLLAQLTRHRLASYSVQSQRYAGIADNIIIVPETAEEKSNKEELEQISKQLLQVYQDAIDAGIPEEDARFFLPQGISTKLIMTMNARELRHFFALRCCNRAQWEIRELADMMYKQVGYVAPFLFEDAGPGCVRGACPEGKKCCGHPRDMDALKEVKTCHSQTT